jgi:hypothetical protein
VDDRDNAQRALMYTLDRGTHWHKQALRPRDFAYDCQVFEGDLLCSADLGFRLLTLHPNDAVEEPRQIGGAGR